MIRRGAGSKRAAGVTAESASGGGPAASGRGDLAVLCAVASVLLVVHFLLGDAYGFHRDELQFLDDARHLDWGFVAYPPITSALGRMAVALFGISPQVLRLPAALVNMGSLVLVGLLARELGGGRAAQLLALVTALPLGLAFASVLQYNTPDLFAWTALIFCTARVLRSGDERWWVGAGVALGLGALSKYSIGVAVIALLVGLAILPSERHHLRSRWFWWGALLAVGMASPNLIWLLRHNFITLRMESSIHARDIRLGRTAGYFTDQLKYAMLALPLMVAGLVRLLRSARFRLLAVFYMGPLVIFALLRGRGYYLLPAYVVLFAAGAVVVEQAILRLHSLPLRVALRGVVVAAMLVDAGAIATIYLPMWPAGSARWLRQVAANNDLADEIGWPEFVAQVAAMRDALPAEDRRQLAVLADNYGEAGALALYGPQYGLPTPISTVNSFHDRGYGPFVPEAFLITGSDLDSEKNFTSCRIAGIVHIPYGVKNEESRDHPEVLLCRGLRKPIGPLWAAEQTFG